ncbi:MAG: DUF4037 domain-containing protein [Anaerolineaceae bacterium]|nr:DUF4037 domain-containing protein [Anaerolineaceae bacterium]
MFINGIELSRRFFTEVVQPLMNEHQPQLEYTAALIGSGSEVLGFDTEMSSDHHWGPRVMLFLTQKDISLRADLDVMFAHSLPYTFYGYPTHFGNPDEIGVRLMREIDRGPVAHRVEMSTLSDYLDDYLPVDVLSSMSSTDWLLIPQQKLRSLTVGAVYHDGIGELTELRKKLRWYPDPVWFYQLMSVWARIGQEEHLMGRCAIVEDEIGSALLAGTLTRAMMQLGFLIEQTYAPYQKWFGTAFRQLKMGSELYPVLEQFLKAEDWQARQGWYIRAIEYLAEKYNQLGISEPVSTKTVDFFSRPIKVIMPERFVNPLSAMLSGTELEGMRPLGGVDLFSASTDFLEQNDLCRGAAALYPAPKEIGHQRIASS